MVSINWQKLIKIVGAVFEKIAISYLGYLVNGAYFWSYTKTKNSMA
jgi:hypothetical protein